jgi:Replication-relaxation
MLYNPAQWCRHARQRPDTVNVVLTPRDRTILALLDFYKVLSTRQLLALLNLSHMTSRSALYRRLRQLWRARVLSRPRIAGLLLRMTQETPDLVWSLGPKGRLALGLPPERYAKHPRDEELSFLFARHQFHLAEFLSAVVLACHQHARVRLALERPQQWTVQDVVVIPDGQFALTHLDGSGTARFAVELDQGSVPLNRWIVSKGWGYAEYYRTHQQPFVVLVIAPTPGRRDTLRGKVARFLAEAAAKGTFYPEALWAFTDRAAYDPARPETLLAPIWLPARAGKPVSILAL